MDIIYIFFDFKWFYINFIKSYFTMVNNKLIVERIGKIIEENNLSASSFAKMIGVQR